MWLTRTETTGEKVEEVKVETVGSLSFWLGAEGGGGVRRVILLFFLFSEILLSEDE